MLEVQNVLLSMIKNIILLPYMIQLVMQNVKLELALEWYLVFVPGIENGHTDIILNLLIESKTHIVRLN